MCRRISHGCLHFCSVPTETLSVLRLDHLIRNRGTEIGVPGGPQVQSLWGIMGPIALAEFLLRNSTACVELGTRAGEATVCSLEGRRW